MIETKKPGIVVPFGTPKLQYSSFSLIQESKIIPISAAQNTAVHKKKMYTRILTEELEDPLWVQEVDESLQKQIEKRTTDE